MKTVKKPWLHASVLGRLSGPESKMKEITGLMKQLEQKCLKTWSLVVGKMTLEFHLNFIAIKLWTQICIHS